MNMQDKLDFIRAHPEHYDGLTIAASGYTNVPEAASFNKVLHDGTLQFTTQFGGNPDNTRYFNINLDNIGDERIDELYDQLENLVLFFDS